MNNEAIERDEALEETTKGKRPYDPDAMIQFNITCRAGLKRAVMEAGAKHRMSAAKYASVLLANALGNPALNSPPEKSAPAAQKGADGMTDQERAQLDAKHKAQICVIEAKHQEEVTRLQTEIRAVNKIAGAYQTELATLKKSLLFAMRLAEALDSGGAEYYKVLLDICDMTNTYNEWKEQNA